MILETSYGNRIRAKYTAKRVVQIAGMILGARSSQLERNVSAGVIVTWILLFFSQMHDKVKKIKCIKYQSFLRALKTEEK